MSGMKNYFDDCTDAPAVNFGARCDFCEPESISAAAYKLKSMTKIN
jgi:hypothetical protein